MPTLKWRRLVLLLAIVGTIGCDRVTKQVATTTLRGMPSRTFVGGVVRLGYAENTGGFLSLGADLPPTARTLVFTYGTGLMLTALGLFAIWRRPVGWSLIGITLFFAGSASNWVDRLIRGSVVDFINVGIGPVRTGIFNIADVAIMAGMTIVIFHDIAGRGGPNPADTSNAAP